QEIIVLCVRWYLSFKLSARDLVQMMTERGIVLAHTTILRWVQGEGPVDLSLSSRRQTRANSGFFVERTTGCSRSQTFFPHSDERQRDALGDHARRVCGVASVHPRIEIRGPHVAASASPIE